VRTGDLLESLNPFELQTGRRPRTSCEPEGGRDRNPRPGLPLTPGTHWPSIAQPFSSSAAAKCGGNRLQRWMVNEVGKSRVEAEADTAEAIDFIIPTAVRHCYAAPQPLTPHHLRMRSTSSLHSSRCRNSHSTMEFSAGNTRGNDNAALVTGNTVVLAVER
jgi:hypothetical protein